jgi:flagellar basal-body rod modification protein FlgD
MLGVDLAGPAAQVTVTVRDAEGNVVRTLALGARGAGAHTAPWDGADAEGNALPPGRYTFEVSAAAADGSAVSAERFARGTASRLAVDPDGVRIWLGDLSVPLSALRGVVG